MPVKRRFRRAERERKPPAEPAHQPARPSRRGLCRYFRPARSGCLTTRVKRYSVWQPSRSRGHGMRDVVTRTIVAATGADMRWSKIAAVGCEQLPFPPGACHPGSGGACSVLDRDVRARSLGTRKRCSGRLRFRFPSSSLRARPSWPWSPWWRGHRCGAAKNGIRQGLGIRRAPEPAADELAARDQGRGLGRLPLGHLARPVGRRAVIRRC